MPRVAGLMRRNVIVMQRQSHSHAHPGHLSGSQESWVAAVLHGWDLVFLLQTRHG